MKGFKKQIEIANKILSIEVKNLAEQANGEALIRYGETEVLATCVMGEEARTLGFFPLTVDYEERYYAAGKIRGPRYIKREGRPSDEAICVARMVDRAIRPLFPKDLRRKVQIVITCLSWDGENDPDILSLLAASVALSISDIPWKGPVGCVRIGGNEEKLLFNPTYQERENSKIDVVFGAIEEKGEILLNMIDGKGEEIGENTILKAFDKAVPLLRKLIKFQEEIRKEIGKEKAELKVFNFPDLEKEIKEFLGNKLREALFGEKEERMEKLKKIREDLIDLIEGKYPQDEERKIFAFDFLENEIRKTLTKMVLKEKIRPDGRKPEEIRKLHMEAGLLPRTHGSGLFCRGKTKTLSILTLGAPGDVQLLEGMEIVGKKRFMHHYNFPPYSVGEVSPIRGPGRREIGHGMLVEKALLPLVPDFEEFPYTLRVVSEVLSSNGSTSMASVCSSSLALMDGGVPIKRPAAGIALGIIKEGDKFEILTDIQGPEDHYGGMDFKVAGTKKGITALQMDVKIPGIDREILEKTLKRGKEARIRILEEMAKVLPKSREKLSPTAPRIYKIQIKPEKIREVIGPGGRVIHEIIEKCEVSIDIQQDGKIYITAEKDEAAKKAISWIKNITREVKVGEIFQGKVKRILNFGAIVEIFPGQEGLIHISNLNIKGRRPRRVSDVLRVGDIVSVKVISIDELGRINLLLLKNKKRLWKK